MKVWVNKHLSELGDNWEVKSSVTLRIINTTGRSGKLFHRVFLGCKKIKGNYYIFINTNRYKNPLVEKTCGIWVDTEDYKVDGKESYTGRTRNGNAIVGRFGIYEIGTIIENSSGSHLLDEKAGWIPVLGE